MSEKIVRSSTVNPIFSQCCNSGNVVLPLLSTPPVSLMSLLEGTDAVARDFRENIWKYNRAFAFTSLQVTEDHSVNMQHRGPPVFRIQGELHHRSSPLCPSEDRPPTYAQLYFYDPQAALEYCSKQNSGLRIDTLRSLQHMLLTCHQYAHVYQHAYEFYGTTTLMMSFPYPYR